MAPPQEGAMSELKVPTIAVVAEVLCADGRRFRGRIFVPTAAMNHSGATRAAEWMNEPARFFPFLPDDLASPVLVNKREVLVLSVDAEADDGNGEEDPNSPVRQVAIEAEKERLDGRLLIEMPQNQARVLDYLNRPEMFLTLRAGHQHHLVQKERITRVIEIREK
jgi:hypothetical protein